MSYLSFLILGDRERTHFGKRIFLDHDRVCVRKNKTEFEYFKLKRYVGLLCYDHMSYFVFAVGGIQDLSFISPGI